MAPPDSDTTTVNQTESNQIYFQPNRPALSAGNRTLATDEHIA